VTLHRAAINAREADDLYAALLDDVNWQQEHIRIMGKTIPLPRLTAWYGDEGRYYTYSGITMPAAPWISPLLRSREVAQQLADAPFNSVLCNLYRDGNDSVGWHADDERELGPSRDDIAIGSVSLGAPRRFVLKHRRDGRRLAFELGHGSLFVMRGRTQQRWLHALPKTQKPCAPRLNLTFRVIRLG
jgi:alkylated DNA repair dioxygenase AlkB